jgi:hypothetical protein
MIVQLLPAVQREGLLRFCNAGKDQIVPTQGRGIALRDVDAEFKLP